MHDPDADPQPGSDLPEVIEESVGGLVLQRRLAEIARRLRLLEAAMDQARDGMVVTDTEAGEGGPRVVWVNPVFANLVGVPAAELVGTRLYAVPLLRASQRRIANGLVKRGRWEAELTHGPIAALRSVEVRFSAVLDDAGEATHYVGVVRDITDKKLAEDRLQHLAHHDHLTGLPNRKLLLDRLTLALARARRYASTLGILFIDLDGFKIINDTLGHGVGDRVLMAVADRLRALVRASDTVARLGGDEFVLLLPEVQSIDNAHGVADKVLQMVSEVIRVGDHELFVTPSIGLAVWPDHGAEVHELLQRADQAMYAAKARGKACCVVWAPELGAEERSRSDLIVQLQQASRGEGLHLDAQPIVRAGHGPVGVECFLRWTDPDRGPISPAAFLELIAEAGLSVDVLRALVRDGARAVGDRGLALAFDVRPEWLLAEGAVEALLDTLAEEGLPPERCWIEVAEAHLLELPHAASEALHRLRTAGLRIIVDHYGTSHLSVPLLRRLPLDALKLHGSLIGALGTDDALIQGLVTLCDSLGLEVIASGVSGFADRDALTALGITVQEGPIHGRPGPLTEVVRSLRVPKASAS